MEWNPSAPVAFRLALLCQARDHDDNLDIVFLNHSPPCVRRALHWPHGGDVHARVFTVTGSDVVGVVVGGGWV